MEHRAIIPQEEIVAAANQIARRLSGRENFDQVGQAVEVLSLARYALQLRSGEIPTIAASDLLDAVEIRKAELAQDKIRQLLCPLVLEARPRGYRRFFEQGIQEVSDFLGRDNHAKLRKAIEGMTDVERDLFISVAPVDLLRDLDFFDIDTCDAGRMAYYIGKATLGKRVASSDDNLEVLIVTAVEREESESIRLVDIIEHLCSMDEDSANRIFETLIESAQYAEFMEQLLILFESNIKTSNLARRIRRLIELEDPETAITPAYRLSQDR